MSIKIAPHQGSISSRPGAEQTVTDLPLRIIFIHGLNSPYTGAGARHGESEVVGLKPIKSPFELPQATTAYTFYHGGNLLDDVDRTEASYNWPDSQSHKRTILICHGSGGFIVKEALLRSLNGSDEHQAFRQSILGVIFIGTPHSTSDARLPYQLNLMQRHQIPGTQGINMNIVASVSGLLRSFTSVDWSCLEVAPVSFFEQVDLSGAPEDFGPIVNCEDVQIEGQKHIGLHADHWSTWNFIDRLSSTYKAVSTVIQSFYHSLHAINSDTSFQQKYTDVSGLLRSLHVNNTERLSTAMKGTCSWISDQQPFESWVRQPSGLLWIKGKPGSGKTTLLRHMYQTVTFREPTILLFFHFNYPTHSSVNAMLRSLIFQLLVTRPDYQLQSMRDTYAIRTETYGDYGTNWQWDDPELISYLQESFQHSTQDNAHFVIFLDALDECTEQASVNSIILDILAIPSIRICASSRSSPQVLNIEAHMIILEDLNTADIMYYTKSRVSLVEFKDSSIQRDLIHSLTEASDGMFLYVHLALSNLEIWLDQADILRDGQLGHMEFPRSLEDLYSLIIAKIESSEKGWDAFRHIFQWAAFATRPLTVPELMNALAFEKVEDYNCCSHDSGQTLDIVSDLTLGICACAERITSPCRGFIAVQYPITAPRQPVVTFTHRSVLDFLMAYEPLVSQPDILHLHGHGVLARSCCSVILSETRSRRKGYSGSDSGTRQISSYALQSWMPHLRKALELGLSGSDLFSDLSQGAFLENSLALNESIASSRKVWPKLTYNYTVDVSWEAKQWKTSSPLLLTSAVGHVDSCRRYLSLGESYNERDSLYGITPLGWAAAYGHSEVVELLLDSGAEIDYTPSDTSPLHLAIRCGNKRVVQQLLNKGSIMSFDPTITIQSALSQAASLGRASMIALLVSYGANALTADDLGCNPLHYAISAGKRATLARLLSTIPKTSFEKLKDLPPHSLPAWVHRVLLAFGLGLYCRGSGDSSSSATNSETNGSGKSSKRGSQGSKKRARDVSENMDENDQQSMAPPPQKQSRQTFEYKFACPYHKRWPNRFGGACFNFGFSDMHRLKKHFLGCHKLTRCGRCKSIFPEIEIQDHQISIVACEPVRIAMNYEDGFDSNQSDTLKSLKPKQFETPVHHWGTTFNAVFPDWTTDLPSPYHETTETECRISVARRLRSEEFRQEVWRNSSDMGREVFERLANILDPGPRTSTRPGTQSLMVPDELPIRPVATQENWQTAFNSYVETSLPTEPQSRTVESAPLAEAPRLSPSSHRYRPIPPHFLFPQQVSDALSLSLFSGTGSLNSFGPGQESMYSDMDGNDASISSWNCSFADAQMGQRSNDPLEFTFDLPAPADIFHSSSNVNQPNRNPGISASADTEPAEGEELDNTFWSPSRGAD
ncbi:hypothetical protein FGADI_270 [Fusarium gaditjirri]|uniref:Nephrocystin 3-like N-terminal domain-containing protein n=1 Tax=Fusarium gaditjirri TaxID=282569 RepID=A0A8H4TNX8_9HYPO|nr:hypothetical protein FGADI_270 [Fusarium gaditjirri]